MSDDSDYDFGFGSSAPFSDHNEPSTTTPEAVIDNGSEQEQGQQKTQGKQGHAIIGWRTRQ